MHSHLRKGFGMAGTQKTTEQKRADAAARNKQVAKEVSGMGVLKYGNTSKTRKK
jgi:hypothetical protein